MVAHSPTSTNGASPTPTATMVPATMADVLLPLGTQAPGARRTLSAILVSTAVHSPTSPHRANPTPPASLVPASMTDSPLRTHGPPRTLSAILFLTAPRSTHPSQVPHPTPPP